MKSLFAIIVFLTVMGAVGADDFEDECRTDSVCAAKHLGE